MNTLAPINLRLANLRRWLDKRVPLNAVNPVLSDDDSEILTNMIKKQDIPIIVRYAGGEKPWEIVVCEKLNTPSKDFYVFMPELPDLLTAYNFVFHAFGLNNIGCCRVIKCEGKTPDTCYP